MNEFDKGKYWALGFIQEKLAEDLNNETIFKLACKELYPDYKKDSNPANNRSFFESAMEVLMPLTDSTREPGFHGRGVTLFPLYVEGFLKALQGLKEPEGNRRGPIVSQAGYAVGLKYMARLKDDYFKHVLLKQYDEHLIELDEEAAEKKRRMDKTEKEMKQREDDRKFT